jgi:hypothetical protein
MLNIVTINYYLDGDNIVNTTVDGSETLLDADLVIVDPSKFSALWEPSIATNRNTATVYSPYSDRIRRVFNSRVKEISTLLERGKIIIVFACPVNGFNGEEGDSGSYSIITNYHIIPIRPQFLINDLVPGKSTGNNSIILANPKSLFAPYYNAFKDELEYSAYLENGNISQNFLVNRSKKPVGFSFEILNGMVVFLPPPSYNSDDEKLLGVLISCAKKILTKHEQTPPPDWIMEYKLYGEDVYDDKLEKLHQNLESISNEIQKAEIEKSEIIKYKALLYEQGPELEKAVLDSFKLFGFKAENRKSEDIEHDVVFESKEGKGVAEIEGKDKDSIHLDKYDQLNRVMDEDFHLTGNYPQGILIGNHYRLSKPDNRKEPFTTKVLTTAKQKNIGLLTTIEIFNAIRKVLENPGDEAYKAFCRKAILHTTGDLIKLT